MEIRLLFATPDPESQALLDSLLASALELTPLNATVNYAATQEALLARANAGADDVVVLDWLMVKEEASMLTFGFTVGGRELVDWDGLRCLTLIGSHIGKDWRNTVMQDFANAWGRGANE